MRKREREKGWSLGETREGGEITLNAGETKEKGRYPNK